MENKLKNLIDLAKSLPESRLDVAIEKLTEIKRESEKEKIRSVPECPRCGGKSVVRNGHQSGKQQYLCKECGGSFVETIDSAIAHSHSGEAVWKQVIRDTIEGTAIDKTAAEMELHHETVFNMRHKILYCLEQERAKRPKLLEGVRKADETYILESQKGRKIPDDYHREAKETGAKAQNAAFQTNTYAYARQWSVTAPRFQRLSTEPHQAKKNFAMCSQGALTAALFCFLTGRKTMGFCLKAGNV